MNEKKHGMTGRRNAAKSPEERISGQRITLALGSLAEPVSQAAETAEQSVSAWVRGAIEERLDRSEEADRG